MEPIGKVSKIGKETYFEWRIENFLSLPETDGFYDSPSFFFADVSWYLSVYPNYEDLSERTVAMLLCASCDSPGLPMTADFSLAIRTSKGTVERKTYNTEIFGDFSKAYYANGGHLPRAELLERKSELLPGGAFIMVCSIKIPNSTADERFEKLSNDLQRMMESGDHSDTTVKVKGEEFRLHRSILRVRNPFFNSMFKSEMKENITGIVSIEDCEPDLFRPFIHFVYTGKVTELSVDNVCGVYELADKYQDDQLKNECLQFMLKSISEDSDCFCDFVVLALRHDEKDFIEKATNYFASNAEEIICCEKWIPFVVEHPICANEMHIKTLKARKRPFRLVDNHPNISG